MSNPKILMKTFGNAKEVRDDTKRQSMGGGLQSTPKDGVTIRLLTGPEGWARFSEYYDEDAQTFVPVVEGDTLPAGSRPSIRYVANALWQSEGAMQGKVVAFKMPKKVAIMLLNKMEKYGTLTDRDYEITKMGEGMNTDYDVTPESPSKVNLKKYELLDLEEKLVEEYNRAMGRINGDDNNATNDDDEEETPKGKRPAKSTAPAKKGVSRKQEEEEDDDEAVESIDFAARLQAAQGGHGALPRLPLFVAKRLPQLRAAPTRTQARSQRRPCSPTRPTPSRRTSRSGAASSSRAARRAPICWLCSARRTPSRPSSRPR